MPVLRSWESLKGESAVSFWWSDSALWTAMRKHSSHGVHGVHAFLQRVQP